MTPDELARHWGLLAVRELPDGSIAGIQRLMTTVSVVLGIDEWQWEYRFCYRDLQDAIQGLAQVQSVRDVPEGWIACRPQVTVGHGPDSRYPTPAELRELRARAQAGTAAA
jgi:hypothetical protein